MKMSSEKSQGEKGKLLLDLIECVATSVNRIYEVDEDIDISLIFRNPHDKNNVVMMSNMFGDELKNFLTYAMNGIDSQDMIDDILRKARDKKALKDGVAPKPDVIDRSFGEKLHEMIDEYYTENSAYILLIKDLEGPARLHSNLTEEQGSKMLASFARKVCKDNE